ncbi:MAG: secretin N-terminal domain-containing protein [Kiritimatiellae bacterium]|nr:secretin N-terminal domain-containing protein [Kiritimatiellia bacterium]
MKSYCSLFVVSAVLLSLNLTAQEQAQSGPAAEAAVVVVSPAGKDDEAIVTISFDETPLSDVIKAFRDATSANIISSGTNLNARVSVRLDNVPWRKGLNSVLEPQGMQLSERPVGSGIYVVEVITIEIPKITRTFLLDNADVTAVSELFKSVLGERGQATAFTSSNTLIITAPEKEMNECELIIKAIDAPSQQVYIEARFVEMSTKAGRSLGLRWDSLGGDGWGMSFDGASLGYNNQKATSINKSNVGETVVETDDGAGNTTSLTMPVIPDYATRSKLYTRDHAFTGSLSADAFRLAMNAFESTDGVSVFSNPKVIVANEQKAKIDMTTKEPNVEVDYQAATTEGQSDSVSTKLAVIPGEEEPFVGEAFFSYGITLNVKPRISSTGLITVTIEPSISEKISDYIIQGLDNKMPASRYPIIDMRRIQTVFAMQSGRTAVIGGLSRTSDTSMDNGIPLLKDIPWLGPRIFGWKSREKTQKEIVIFVTVGIADPITIEEDAGMPQNAILSREILTGEAREPVDMTRAELLDLSDKKVRSRKETTKATEQESAGDVAELSAVQVAPVMNREPEPILAE